MRPSPCPAVGWKKDPDLIQTDLLECFHCLESIFLNRHNLWALLSQRAEQSVVCRWNFLVGCKSQLLSPMGYLLSASIAVVVAPASKGRFVLEVRDSGCWVIEQVFKDSRQSCVKYFFCLLFAWVVGQDDEAQMKSKYPVWCIPSQSPCSASQPCSSLLLVSPDLMILSVNRPVSLYDKVTAVDDLWLGAVMRWYCRELGMGSSPLPAAPKLCSLLWLKQELLDWC